MCRASLMSNVVLFFAWSNTLVSSHSIGWCCPQHALLWPTSLETHIKGPQSCHQMGWDREVFMRVSRTLFVSLSPLLDQDNIQTVYVFGICIHMHCNHWQSSRSTVNINNLEMYIKIIYLLWRYLSHLLTLKHEIWLAKLFQPLYNYRYMQLMGYLYSCVYGSMGASQRRSNIKSRSSWKKTYW